MEYSNTYFGKNLDDLVYQDIIDFFNVEREESDKIEFKSFSTVHGNLNKNFEGVIRAICAMLNSEGGIVIWGAPEGTVPAGRTEKVFTGALSPVNELKEKDWLISKASDSITPLPVGINVKMLNDSANYVYVFEIKKSEYRPHQYNNIYYARLDGQTKPASHYFVEALFKQIKFPNIEGYLKFDRISNNGTFYFLDLSIILFNFSELQNEENISFRLMCPQGVFSTYGQVYAEPPIYNKDGQQLVYKEFASILSFGTPHIHNDQIRFTPNSLLTNFQNKVELFLSFQGKKSPSKISEYELDFNKIDWGRMDNPNYLISSLNENVLMSERQEALGTNKETTLNNILNR